MQWNAQQAKALDAVGRWLREKDRQVFTLQGYAGTGKTTIARQLAEQSDGHVVFAAYTGKAASVLRRAGCINAQTIHSLIYSVSDHDRTHLTELELDLAALRDLRPDDAWAIMGMERQIEDLRAEIAHPRFTLQAESDIMQASLVVVDESSMIDSKLATDLESFGIPILAMGDPFQLPPVKRSAGHYDTETPDMMLTEIHRQAAESAILRWATYVREERKELPYKMEGEALKMSKHQLRYYDAVDLTRGQLLTGKNETRQNINRKFRAHLGRTALYPVAGDQLVALRNAKDFGMLNGVTCRAVTDSEPVEGEPCVQLDIDYEGRIVHTPVERHCFDAYNDPTLGTEPPGTWQERQWMMPMDYAYALTVHKAQGSQWSQVVVCDDGMFNWQPTMRMRWLYTAITRAQHELIILS